MRNFPGSLILPYQDRFGGVNITAHKKSNQAPRAVTLTIPWAQYAAKASIPGGTTVFNAAVAFDLATGTTAAALDIVKMVFIDNTAVDRPVTLQCADTGQQVTCPDGSAGFYPLITNGTGFTLFTDNIIPLNTGKQSTRLIFSNASFDTFSAPELNRAQQLFRASGSSNFTTPVLSDKLAVVGFNVGATTASQQILPASAGFQNVITALKGSIVCGNVTAGSFAKGTFSLTTGAGGATVIASGVFYSAIGSSGVFIDAPALQINYDAGNPITLTIDNTTGNATAVVNFLMTYAQIQLPAVSN